MIKPLFTRNAPPPFSNYSQAIETLAGSRMLFVAGQVGVGPDGTLGETEERQHELAWSNVLAILDAAGMDANDIADAHVYITRPESVALYRQVRDRKLQGARPAATLIVVAGLADPKYLVEVSVVAARSVG